MTKILQHIRHIDLVFKIALVLALALALINFPTAWRGENKFITTLLSGIFTTICLVTNPYRISIHRSDVFFLIFIAWSGISYTWAYETSLVLTPTWSLLFLFCFYKNIASFQNLSFLLKVLVGIISINLILQVHSIVTIAAAGFVFEIKNHAEFSRYFRENGNYITSCNVMLFPFLILAFSKIKALRIWIIILLVCNTSIVLLMNSRASTIALMLQLVGLFYIYIIQKGNRQNIIKAILLALSCIALTLFFVKDKYKFFYHYNPLKDIDLGGDDRLQIWSNTFEMVFQHPLLGVGKGNWQLVHLAGDMGSYISFFNKVGFYRHPHNQLLHIWSETGLIGLILTVLLVSIILRSIWSNLKKYGLQENTFILILIIGSYAIISSFYGVGYITCFDSSVRIPQLIVLCTMAYFFQKVDSSIFQIKPYWLVIVMLPILGNYYKEYKAKELEQLYLSQKRANKSYQALKTLNQINKLGKLYYAKGSYIKEKALILKSIKKRKQAISVLKHSLEHFPYFEDWYLLGKWHGNNTAKAKYAFEQAYKHNSTSIKIHIELAKIEIKENRPKEAKKWVNYYYSLAPTEKDRELGDKNKIVPNRYKIIIFKNFRPTIQELENEIKNIVK